MNTQIKYKTIKKGKRNNKNLINVFFFPLKFFKKPNHQYQTQNKQIKLKLLIIINGFKSFDRKNAAAAINLAKRLQSHQRQERHRRKKR